jgi:fused signal recognition particle receptor
MWNLSAGPVVLPFLRVGREWAVFRSIFKRVESVIRRGPAIEPAQVEEIEEDLILADLGPHTAAKIARRLTDRDLPVDEAAPDPARARLHAVLMEILGGARPAAAEPAGTVEPPRVVLVVGVNGVGKTTSIAKLAARCRAQGAEPILAAADTFRAAAIDQLRIWADRVGADVVAHKEGSDPAAVVFDAIQAARARGAGVVIADTAGRQHTKSNLMEELRKINRVVERELGRPADESILVLDATAGQNMLNQAAAFAEAVPVTGIFLTKTDGTASGGAVVTVVDRLKIPIQYLGTGEKLDAIRDFDAEEFARQLVA